VFLSCQRVLGARGWAAIKIATFLLIAGIILQYVRDSLSASARQKRSGTVEEWWRLRTTILLPTRPLNRPALLAGSITSSITLLGWVMAPYDPATPYKMRHASSSTLSFVTTTLGRAAGLGLVDAVDGHAVQKIRSV